MNTEPLNTKRAKTKTRTIQEAQTGFGETGALRVLVLAPCGREVAPICEGLAQAGMRTLFCRDALALGEALREGAGAALVTEEALTTETLEVLTTILHAQPRWSELPLLLYLNLGEPGAACSSAAKTLRARRGVVVLERPLHRATLVSVVRLALDARRRQYEVRDLLEKVALDLDLDPGGRPDEPVQEPTATLRHAESHFLKIFYASPLPVTLTTLAEGRYLDANESALKLLGFGRDEVIGRTASELSGWVQETPGARDDLLRRVLEEGSLRDVPIKFRTKAGGLRDGLAAFELIELKSDLCLLSMVLDVTARKQDEAELMRAVQAVMCDSDWFSRSLIEKLAQVRSGGNPGHQAEIEELTPREKQVLERVARGHSNEQIAAELNLSENTVRNYLANVFSKLDLHTRADAVVWARVRGLGSGV